MRFRAVFVDLDTREAQNACKQSEQDMSAKLEACGSKATENASLKPDGVKQLRMRARSPRERSD